VDVLYDNGNLLYLSAGVPLNVLYLGEALQFEFRRTQSRLTEMQSQAWLESFRA
jgi:cell division protein ZapE